MCVVLAALLTDSVKMRVNAVEYFFISGYQEKTIKLGLSFAVVDTIFVLSNFFADILGTNNAKPSIRFPKGPDPNRKRKGKSFSAVRPTQGVKKWQQIRERRGGGCCSPWFFSLRSLERASLFCLIKNAAASYKSRSKPLLD